MNLHNDKEEFYNIITNASLYFYTNPAIIEKDYYVTLFLSELCKIEPNILFKDGTSLSKCYKVI